MQIRTHKLNYAINARHLSEPDSYSIFGHELHYKNLTHTYTHALTHTHTHTNTHTYSTPLTTLTLNVQLDVHKE